jgi:hypothetical protein
MRNGKNKGGIRENATIYLQVYPTNTLTECSLLVPPSLTIRTFSLGTGESYNGEHFYYWNRL